MTERFDTNSLLYPILKGDDPGHPFRGNQWTAAGHGMMGNKYNARTANAMTHTHWAQGDMKNNSPITTKFMGQSQPPTGAHFEQGSPSKILFDADNAARVGDHATASALYGKASEHMYGPDKFNDYKGDDYWQGAQAASAYHAAKAA